MCLSIPGTVVSIEGATAVADIGGVRCRVATHLVDEISVGDHVLVHSGYILEKLDPERAAEMISMINKLTNDEPDNLSD